MPSSIQGYALSLVPKIPWFQLCPTSCSSTLSNSCSVAMGEIEVMVGYSIPPAKPISASTAMAVLYGYSPKKLLLVRMACLIRRQLLFQYSACAGW